MCINFRPIGKDTLRKQLNLIIGEGEWPDEVWQDYPAPILRRSSELGGIEAMLGTFGMVPQSQLNAGKRFTTMNARIETVSELRSFSRAWANFQFCLVPMTTFCEPHYGTGKSIRWNISKKDGDLFCVAGLWREWPNRTEVTPYSFTLLTTNADQHEFLKQFHKPDDEKRSLIIIPPDRYPDWLNCNSHNDIRELLHLMPADWYGGEPNPIPPRPKKSKIEQ